VDYHTAGRLDEADELYARVSLADPSNFDALHLSGMIALQRGRYEDAAALLRRALDHNPASAPCEMRLGVALAALAEHPKALIHLQAAVARSSDMPEGWCHLGVVQRSLGKTASARASLERAVALRPHFVEALEQLGALISASLGFEEAVPVLRRLVALQPSSALSIANLGVALAQSGHQGEALGYLDRAVQIDPTLSLAHTGRALVLQETHRIDEAVEAYRTAQGLFRTDETPDPEFSDTIALDLSTVEPSLAGPKRPQDRVPLSRSKAMFREALAAHRSTRTPATVAAAIAREDSEGGDQPQQGPPAEPPGVACELRGASFALRDGAVVIAAITSCTNTSNPSVMLAAGMLARNAVAAGLSTRPWVKTSLAPGSKVVTEYFRAAGVMPALERLGFNLVGYGCTTCIGNSGPLPAPIAEAVERHDLTVAAVLSGNRNFEGRVNPLTRFNYLASPPLVVAYALAGRMDIDFATEPLGIGTNGPVFLRDVWPTARDVETEVLRSVRAEMFRTQYADVFAGDAHWQGLAVPAGTTYAWDPASTYVKHPPYFEGMTRTPPGVRPITGARVLAMLGDSITTDHISPAGTIAATSPAGRWLLAHGVAAADFNSYGARRGHDEVMVRGTFANIRLRNELVPGVEGGWTTTQPGGARVAIYDAAVAYQAAGTPLVILAGREYGTGSSRDWAAKGTLLLGVRAVIAESFERIHRSNLVGMGVLPLEYADGATRVSLGLTGFESFDLLGLDGTLSPKARLRVRATDADGSVREFAVVARIDTPEELSYYAHGGILPYVLRQLLRDR